MYERLGGESGGPGAYQNWSASVDAHWYFLGRAGVRHWRPESVQPYLIAGIGAINDKVDGSSTTPSGDKTSFMWNAGVGVLWPFSSWGRVVGDVRYRWDDNRGGYGNGGSFGDWLFSLGLQIPLGQPPRVAEAPRAAPPPAPVPVPVPAPAPVVKPAPPPPPKPVVRNFDLSADGMFAFDQGDAHPRRAQPGRQPDPGPQIRGRHGHVDDDRRAHRPDRYGGLQPEVVAGAGERRARLHGEPRRPGGCHPHRGARRVAAHVTEADCKAKGQAKTQSALIACLLPNRRVVIQAAGEQRG